MKAGTQTPQDLSQMELLAWVAPRSDGGAAL